MSFTPQAISGLKLLGEQVAEDRSVAAEIKIGTEYLPELRARENQQREFLARMLPSKIISFDTAVQQTFASIRQTELTESTLRESLSRLETTHARLQGEMRRSVQELVPGLDAAIRSWIPSPSQRNDLVSSKWGPVSRDCATALDPDGDLKGQTTVDRAESLIALYKQFGAELPGVVA